MTSSIPSDDPFEPVSVGDEEVDEWSERSSLAFDAAVCWARRMPRAKGAVPRQLGRLFGKNSRLVIRTSSGSKLAVDPSSWEVYTALLRGALSRAVVEACCRVIGSGKVMYDIGANAGIICIEVAHRIGDRVSVYAFEPQPSLARVIAVSARLNDLGNVHVYQIMLGRAQGTAELFVPAHSVHASMVAPEETSKRLACPIRTVDALVADGALPPPDVVKVDVEGAERDVFAGAAETIRRHRPFIVFESNVIAQRFGYTRQELCDDLRQLAPYEFFFVTNAGFEPTGGQLSDGKFNDLIAMPPGRDA